MIEGVSAGEYVMYFFVLICCVAFLFVIGE